MRTRGVRTVIISHPHNCFCIPTDSRTFRDLQLKFPGLSRTKIIFHDFPGLEIFQKKNSRTSQEACKPCTHLCKRPSLTFLTKARSLSKTLACSSLVIVECKGIICKLPTNTSSATVRANCVLLLFQYN